MKTFCIVGGPWAGRSVTLDLPAGLDEERLQVMAPRTPANALAHAHISDTPLPREELKQEAGSYIRTTARFTYCGVEVRYVAYVHETMRKQYGVGAVHRSVLAMMFARLFTPSDS